MMPSLDELAELRQEHEVMDQRRRHSRHVLAELLEACEICGRVRERDKLAPCRWCGDT